MNEYVAVLRCQAWNIWPEKTVIDLKTTIDYSTSEQLPVRLGVLFYLQRASPERFSSEPTEFGPLLWAGKSPSLHYVRDTPLVASGDTTEVLFPYRHVQRGEVDICINFRINGEPTPSLIDKLFSITNIVISILNLQVKDYLIPSMPFQIRKVFHGGRQDSDSTIRLSVCERQTLTNEMLHSALTDIAGVLSPDRKRFHIALELYAAHFTEQQVRVRFLLLVMAIESLTTPTTKHPTAVELLDRWNSELESEMKQFEESSEAWQSLEALSREINFRNTDSVGEQVRKVFSNLPGISPEDIVKLQKRVKCLYNKRSVLLHGRHLPSEDLFTLEEEARELLEKVLFSTLLCSKDD